MSGKRINDFLKTSRIHRTKFGDFLQRFDKMDDIRERQYKMTRTKFSKDVLEKKTAVSQHGLEFDVYVRNPVDVLNRQIEVVPSEGFIYEQFRSDKNTHPLNSKKWTSSVSSCERTHYENELSEIC